MWNLFFYGTSVVLLVSVQVWLVTRRKERADLLQTFEAIIVRLSKKPGISNNEQDPAFLRDFRVMEMNERYMYIARNANLPVWVWGEFLTGVVDNYGFAKRKRGEKLQQSASPVIRILLERASNYQKEGDLLNAGRIALGMISGLEQARYRTSTDQAFSTLLALETAKPGDGAVLRHLASLARDCRSWATRSGRRNAGLWKQVIDRFENHHLTKEAPLRSQTNKAIPNATYFAVADDWI